MLVRRLALTALILLLTTLALAPSRHADARRPLPPPRPAPHHHAKPKPQPRPTPWPTITPAVRHWMGTVRTTIYLPTGNATASGIWPRWGLVACDPSIPFGSTFVVPTLGYFTCADRGGAVFGNHIDVFEQYIGEHHVNDWYDNVYWIAAVG